ncbi:hypothetical protein CupriaWKF_30970 [Cupriavidus sp. WKF15]|uniref:TetR/AcrR family transcriptional regulator n=1 Tax=Cupriavidus sp. WKF15 TaxID=3032282 RepID=UPI0023E2D6F3|nr:hypothetical protein [Cupriavidus sp. WKF15]WER50778.1 hypothetical protein CupriaWKF_30970 [Cupriavidus sp. WKF15]
MKSVPPAEISRLDIARAAGCDPALVRYYFGSKSKLIEAAVLEASAELRDRQAAGFARARTPRAKIKARITGLLEVFYDDPSFYHLALERIIHGKSREVLDMRHDLMYGAVDALEEAINEGVATGEFRRFDPRHLFLAMVGACGYPMSERAVFAELIGKEPTRADLEAYTSSIVDLFLGGLETRPPARRRAATAPKAT